eukprot:3938832-Rhodomonas_salina.1
MLREAKNAQIARFIRHAARTIARLRVASLAVSKHWVVTGVTGGNFCRGVRFGPGCGKLSRLWLLQCPTRAYLTSGEQSGTISGEFRDINALFLAVCAGDSRGLYRDSMFGCTKCSYSPVPEASVCRTQAAAARPFRRRQRESISTCASSSHFEDAMQSKIDDAIKNTVLLRLCEDV